ncbi:hypothetical protein CWM40_29430, partial [Escherichia coli]
SAASEGDKRQENDKAVKAAKEAGFHLELTTMRSKIKTGDNLLLLKRLKSIRAESQESITRLMSNKPEG